MKYIFQKINRNLAAAFLLIFSLAICQAQAIKEKTSTRHCEAEVKAIFNLPTPEYEAALLEANNKILNWFIEYNEQKNLSAQDQKWSYISWSLGSYILSQNSEKSPRIQLLLLGFSENTSEFLRKNKNFDQFTKDNEALALKTDKIRQEIFANNPKATAQIKREIKNIADCAQATGMMAATKNLNK